MIKQIDKWADFLVSAVRYDSNSSNRIISHYKVHIDYGDSLGESRTWTKEEVLKALSNGKSFSTILKDSNGKWKKGEVISITQMNGLFIRTDSKIIAGDYLENTSEF